MKTIITILISAALLVSFSINAEPQNHEMMDGHDKAQSHEMMNGHDGRMKGAMGDYHARSIMMDQIVEDPEMRQEMMHKMMQSMDMQQMMSDPEMKTRMQKHVSMMQSMLDSDAMDHSKMQAMMDNPEVMSMMKMHMMCAETTSAGMMGEHSMENGAEHMH